MCGDFLSLPDTQRLSIILVMFYNDSCNLLSISFCKYFDKSKKVAEGNLLTQRSFPFKCFKTKSDLKRQMKYTKIFLNSDLPGNANINVFFTEK